MSEQEQATPFNEFLAAHSRGVLNDELTAAAADVVKAVSDQNKKGTVTLTLTFEPAGPSGRAMTVAGRVTTKMPAPDPELGIYYADHMGALHRDDPYVSRIPGVPYEEAGEIKVVDTETGEIRRAQDTLPEPVVVDDQPAPEVEEEDADA